MTIVVVVAPGIAQPHVIATRGQCERHVGGEVVDAVIVNVSNILGVNAVGPQQAVLIDQKGLGRLEYAVPDQKGQWLNLSDRRIDNSEHSQEIAIVGNDSVFAASEASRFD